MSQTVPDGETAALQYIDAAFDDPGFQLFMALLLQRSGLFAAELYPNESLELSEGRRRFGVMLAQMITAVRADGLGVLMAAGRQHQQLLDQQASTELQDAP